MSKVHDVLQIIIMHVLMTQLSALLPNEEVNGSVHVCSRCMAFIKKGKIPPFATINNMHVDEIPLELSRLNIMEQRLISRVQAFMKLIVLPLALAGQTINFPANVSEVFYSLPRPLNSDGVVLVKPLESTSAIVSVPTSDQTASTSSGPDSARASTSTNSACANTAQSTCSSTSTRNLYVVRKPLVVDALRCL